MQIDFHHTATYVIARFAGFEPAEAETIAHSAQYVDDATTSGFIRFQNGMRYQRYASSHPMTDVDNLNNDENTVSWLPFHFFPGADGGTPTNAAQYVRHLVCRPDSEPARQMMAAALKTKGQPDSLHRLGIAAHVFVDTFAHQGFAGLHHPINRATDVKDDKGKRLPVIKNLPDVDVPPVGHGEVGICPDMPYLRWSYRNSDGLEIKRDNPRDFARAAHRLCEEFQRYREVPVVGLDGRQADKLQNLFENIVDEDGHIRHAAWLRRLADDYFGFGAVKLEYEGKAAGSWKHDALGDAYLGWMATCEQMADEKIAGLGEKIWATLGTMSGKAFQSLLDKKAAVADRIGQDIPIDCGAEGDFLRSDYKKFHDAAKAQRHEVFMHILPSFGIVAA